MVQVEIGCWLVYSVENIGNGRHNEFSKTDTGSLTLTHEHLKIDYG